MCMSTVCGAARMSVGASTHNKACTRGDTTALDNAGTSGATISYDEADASGVTDA